MADDINKGADFSDDLHLLAGVVGSGFAGPDGHGAVGLVGSAI